MNGLFQLMFHSPIRFTVRIFLIIHQQSSFRGV